MAQLIVFECRECNKSFEFVLGYLRTDMGLSDIEKAEALNKRALNISEVLESHANECKGAVTVKGFGNAD